MLRTFLQRVSQKPDTWQDALCLMANRSLSTSAHRGAAGWKSDSKRSDSSVRQISEEERTSLSNDNQHITHDKPLSTTSFPTQETFSESINGVPFSQIPIVHIKATSNNTIVTATDGDGVVLALQSCGTVGFRNARKGTNVAAQAAAIALADDALRKDIKDVRVCLKGIGPGRLPALKALQIKGLNIVSISDTTPLPHNGNRPKKVRRL